jgi:diacylglycerol kinase family enzyme
MQRVDVVLNPHSRKNRGRDRAGRLAWILGARGVVHVTRDTLELGPLLERILDHELVCLVSDGGDGALHWALNAALPIVEARGTRLPVFLPTNGGTIDFVARKAGVRGRPDRIVARLVDALERGPIPTVEIDSLEIRGLDENRAPFRKIGFAAAIGGIGNRFFDKYYEDPDPGAATIIKVVARAVASLAVNGPYAQAIFAPHKARVRIDGVEIDEVEHRAIHAGAFDVNLGGVFRVFPLAREPGALHFQAGTMTPGEIVKALPALVRGGAIRSSRLRDVRGEVMIVDAIAEPLRPVIDGEIYQGLTRVEVRRGPPISIAKIESPQWVARAVPRWPRAHRRS